MPTRKSSSKKTSIGVRSATAGSRKRAATRKIAAAKKSGKPRRAEAQKPATGKKTPQKRSKKVPAPSTELKKMRAILLELRDRVTGQISFLSDDANHKDDTPTEDRTDEFDRELAFNLVSNEHNALYEIDEALRRIEQKTYGSCEYCRGHIEHNRLQALPFARNCLQCQAELEKNPHWEKADNASGKTPVKHIAT